MLRVVPILVLALAACGQSSTTEPPPPTTPTPAVVAPDALHVFGHDRILGTYHGHSALELVDGSNGGITVLQLWGRTGPDASGIAIAVDEQEGWSEIHANRIGAAPWLPLLFMVGGDERARIAPDGGLRLSPDAERPPCTDTRRGTLWFDRGGAGEADRMLACLRAADGALAWTALSP